MARVEAVAADPTVWRNWLTPHARRSGAQVRVVTVMVVQAEEVERLDHRGPLQRRLTLPGRRSAGGAPVQVEGVAVEA